MYPLISSLSARRAAILWVPVWHRWGAGARQDPHSCCQSSLWQAGQRSGTVPGARGLCHQRWELPAPEEGGAAVPPAGGSSESPQCHYCMCQMCSLPLNAAQLIRAAFPLSPLMCFAGSKKCCPELTGKGTGFSNSKAKGISLERWWVVIHRSIFPE